MLENDRENVHDQPLAPDRFCTRPRLSNEGKLTITMEGIFSIGRDRFAMLQDLPESDCDRLWEGVESDEGGGRKGEEGERV